MCPDKCISAEDKQRENAAGESRKKRARYARARSRSLAPRYNTKRKRKKNFPGTQKCPPGSVPTHPTHFQISRGLIFGRHPQSRTRHRGNCARSIQLYAFPGCVRGCALCRDSTQNAATLLLVGVVTTLRPSATLRRAGP